MIEHSSTFPLVDLLVEVGSVEYEIQDFTD